MFLFFIVKDILAQQIKIHVIPFWYLQVLAKHFGTDWM